MIQKFHSKGNKITSSKRFIHPMFTAALFTIAETRKQPMCPWMAERIKKMWFLNIQ